MAETSSVQPQTSEEHVDDEVGSNEDTPTLCLVCAKKPIEYEPLCGHPSLCKSCAMKQATGGKCKVCSERFYEVRRIA